MYDFHVRNWFLEYFLWSWPHDNEWLKTLFMTSPNLWLGGIRERTISWRLNQCWRSSKTPFLTSPRNSELKHFWRHDGSHWLEFYLPLYKPFIYLYVTMTDYLPYDDGHIIIRESQLPQTPIKSKGMGAFQTMDKQYRLPMISGRGFPKDMCWLHTLKSAYWIMH